MALKFWSGEQGLRNIENLNPAFALVHALFVKQEKFQLKAKEVDKSHQFQRFRSLIILQDPTLIFQWKTWKTQVKEMIGTVIIPWHCQIAHHEFSLLVKLPKSF